MLVGTYDIAIVGAGPAGATLARLLAHKYRVLLIDRRRLDAGGETASPRKACGGLIAPDAQKVLAQLGLGLPASVLVGPQLFAVRTIDLRQKLERYYQRFYINVDREKLDRWFTSLIPSEVDYRYGHGLAGFTEHEQGVTLTVRDGTREYTEQARVLVGADGANSLVRRSLFPTRQPRGYVAIQEWYESPHPLPYFTAVFDSRITDFYCWTIPKGEALLIGAAVKPGPQSEQCFRALLLGLKEYGFNLEHRIRREGAFMLRPRPGQAMGGKERVALVGEAGGWISPSSAEGMSYALRTAINLAASLDPGPEGFLKRYQALNGRLRLNLNLKTAKSPAMYNELLRSAVMRSGLESVHILD
jgi:flavin-dependent dehydrogenase